MRKPMNHPWRKKPLKWKKKTYSGLERIEIAEKLEATLKKLQKRKV